MDSNEAANLANIETARLTRWLLRLTVVLVVLTVIAICLMAWPLLYPPNPLQPPTTGFGGDLMVKGWTPVIVLGTALLVAAVSLIIVAFRQWKNKQLAVQVADLARDLATARKGAKESERSAKEAQLRANEEKNQKDNAYDMYRECERLFSTFAWLHQVASDQAPILGDELVKTIEVRPYGLELTKAPRRVIVELVVKNESVFDVTLNTADAKGCLFFNTIPQTEPSLITLNPREPIKPNQTGTLFIEQPLLKSEAETILEAAEDSHFWLGNLKIPILVEGIPQVIKSQELRIREHVEKLPLNNFNRNTNNT
jgi:hypothetical protein